MANRSRLERRDRLGIACEIALRNIEGCLTWPSPAGGGLQDLRHKIDPESYNGCPRPIGTEGHTGRFWSGDYFIILEGEQWACTPGDLVYRPGQMHHLTPGVARGLIPSRLPFGLADSLSSTLDWRMVAQTLRIYGKSAVRRLARGKI